MMSASPAATQRFGLLRSLLYAASICAGLALVAELAVTTAVRWVAPHDQRFWLFEAGPGMVFDPVLGCALGAEPTRWAYYYGGELQYMRLLHGSERGLPDLDPNAPSRPVGQRRIAVFGDSFSAGVFLERNWPEVAEQELRRAGHSVELLNLSLDGGGLANWHRIATHLLAAENWELDGVVFAVYAPDLRRRFTVCATPVDGHPTFGRIADWDPASIPNDVAEAANYAKPSEGRIVSKQQFEAALAGTWRPARRYRPELAAWVAGLLRTLRYSLATAEVAQIEPERVRVIDELARFANERALARMVVEVPSREEAARAPGNAALRAEVREFASRLGAEYHDGAEAFAALSPEAAGAEYLPREGHWADAGSDRFGRHVAQLLLPWLEAEAAREAAVTPPDALPLR